MRKTRLLPIEENNPTHYRLDSPELGRYDECGDALLNILGKEELTVASELLVAAEKGELKAVYAMLKRGIVSDKCIGMVS